MGGGVTLIDDRDLRIVPRAATENGDDRACAGRPTHNDSLSGDMPGWILDVHVAGEK